MKPNSDARDPGRSNPESPLVDQQQDDYRQATSPGALFLAVLADHCSADDLAHLAAGRRMAEHRSPRLCAEAADQLADLLIAGQRPALGWWRRWRRPPAKVTSVGPIRAEQFVLHEELRVAP